MPSIKKYKYIRKSEQRHSRVEELFSYSVRGLLPVETG